VKNFNYLIQKIEKAKILSEPFLHIYIENFFDENDFQEIINSSGIKTPKFNSDSEMFESLFSLGYKIIDFPGCITSHEEYIEWHKKKDISHLSNTSCESFGLTLRLIKPGSSILQDLKNFIESNEFSSALAKKFDIPLNKVNADNGIQKYLDGYEISPHPDVRKKALTYMININPNNDSEKLTQHTHYLKLKEKYNYVKIFWEGNPDVERCWVPWDWCDSQFVQSQNNSLVMFSPSCSTMHAVKANYNHLLGQRTQLYGNLWFNEVSSLKKLEWENIDLHKKQNHKMERSKFSSLLDIPTKVVSKIKQSLLRRDLSHYKKITRQPDDYK
jgi:hypothetical protein